MSKAGVGLASYAQEIVSGSRMALCMIPLSACIRQQAPHDCDRAYYSSVRAIELTMRGARYREPPRALPEWLATVLSYNSICPSALLGTA